MTETGSGGQRPAPPLVSVILPAYESHDTIGGCLEHIGRQSFRDFETVVVDSSPSPATGDVVRGFPWVDFVRSESRLGPHAARALGVAKSRGTLLVFTDPDIYADRDWLERLVASYRQTGEVIVGALECHGRRWIDRGIHLCKFSKWLPGGEPRPIDMSPTANMMVARADFEGCGGFPQEMFLGDVELSRALERHGRRLWFEPAARAAHHHLHGAGSFLAERYRRGILFGRMRGGWFGERRGRVLLYLAATVLPLRLARIAVLVAGHAWRAGELGWLAVTWPLVFAGHIASLAGEAVAYSRLIFAPTPPERPSGSA